MCGCSRFRIKTPCLNHSLLSHSAVRFEFISFIRRFVVLVIIFYVFCYRTRKEWASQPVNIIFWFRLHFCFELRAMIISVLSLWVHCSVDSFFQCISFRFYRGYQFSSLYVLYQHTHTQTHTNINPLACSVRSVHAYNDTLVVVPRFYMYCNMFVYCLDVCFVHSTTAKFKWARWKRVCSFTKSNQFVNRIWKSFFRDRPACSVNGFTQLCALSHLTTFNQAFDLIDKYILFVESVYSCVTSISFFADFILTRQFSGILTIVLMWITSNKVIKRNICLFSTKFVINNYVCHFHSNCYFFSVWIFNQEHQCENVWHFL